ncbi:MAG: DUF58 domain-containing protein [Sandaracinaceae bacterium]|nr:DUF58 domain-containing protein [Sandaracinaceae bacterium]
MVEKSLVVKFDAKVQALLARARLRVTPRATSFRQGEHPSPIRAKGIEPSDLRPYVPGDDVRRIDWKAFLRSRTLVVRQFEEERNANITLFVDTSASMGIGTPSKLEVARFVAAAIAFVAMRQHDVVESILFAFAQGAAPSFQTLWHPEGWPSWLGTIESAKASGKTDFEGAVKSFVQKGSQRSLAVVISDLLAHGFPQGFRLLTSRGHELHVIAIACDADESPPVEGAIEVIDSESGERLHVEVDESMRQALRQAIRAHREACRESVQRMGGTYVEVNVAMKPEVIVQRIFGGRA